MLGRNAANVRLGDARLHLRLQLRPFLLDLRCLLEHPVGRPATTYSPVERDLNVGPFGFPVLLQSLFPGDLLQFDDSLISRREQERTIEGCVIPVKRSLGRNVHLGRYSTLVDHH
jgi:hypothetical protein